jgi:hypothetical protein
VQELLDDAGVRAAVAAGAFGAFGDGVFGVAVGLVVVAAVPYADHRAGCVAEVLKAPFDVDDGVEFALGERWPVLVGEPVEVVGALLQQQSGGAGAFGVPVFEVVVAAVAHEVAAPHGLHLTDRPGLDEFAHPRDHGHVPHVVAHVQHRSGTGGAASSRSQSSIEVASGFSR